MEEGLKLDDDILKLKNKLKTTTLMLLVYLVNLKAMILQPDPY